MEHRSLDELQRSAQLHADVPFQEPMSQHERLARWAQRLEADPFRRLNTLDQTEYCDPVARDRTRADNSAIAVAFADPVLRAEGLRDDSYGTAKRFFGLTDGQLHHVVCSCHCGATMLARHVAYRIHSVTPRPRTPSPFFRALRQFFKGTA